MPHRLSLGRGETRDVGDDGLRHVLGDVRGGAFFGVAADLADHDDELRVGVGLEGFDGVDVSGADDGVAADADACREPEVGKLVHELVGERARFRHEPDAPRPRDIGRGDADVRLAGRDDPGAVRADEPDAALGGVRVELRRVLHRHALGDDDDKVESGVDGFDDGAQRVRRRNEDDGDVRPRGFLRLRDGSEDGDGNGAGLAFFGPRADGGDVEFHGGPRLAGVDPADDVRARAEHPARVLAPFGPRHSLDDDFRIPIEEDGH